MTDLFDAVCYAYNLSGEAQASVFSSSSSARLKKELEKESSCSSFR